MTRGSRHRALALYTTAWPHVADGIRQAQSWLPLGADWFEVSTPFYAFDDAGDPIAHAGVVTCNWSVAGRAIDVAAVHGVCVHPEHRGTGKGREVLERALNWIDNHAPCETTVLWSEKVELYEKFGFGAMRESVFEGKIAGGTTSVATRRIDPDRPELCERLAIALRTRRPVSNVVAAADTGWHFGINLGLWTAAVGAEAAPAIVELIDDDAWVVGKVEAGTVQLFDVLAPGPLPSLERLAAALVQQHENALSPQRVQVFFSPDRLPSGEQLLALPSADEDVLMVRGDPLGVDQAFAFSPLTKT